MTKRKYPGGWRIVPGAIMSVAIWGGLLWAVFS